MTTLSIKDLTADKEMDRDAMVDVSGGGMDSYWPGFGGFNILSPQSFNKVTPISGMFSAPTVQGNQLNQVDYTNAGNGHGSQFISNNKFGSQSNSNVLSGILNPTVL
ncbi:MAG: hypothetical protein V3V31_08185 [Methylococcales bacterium]